MNVIISLLITAWLIKAATEVLIGMFQIIFGLTAALMGAGILLLILLLDGFAILWKTAFPNVDMYALSVPKSEPSE